MEVAAGRLPGGTGNVCRLLSRGQRPRPPWQHCGDEQHADLEIDSGSTHGPDL